MGRQKIGKAVARLGTVAILLSAIAPQTALAAGRGPISTVPVHTLTLPPAEVVHLPPGSSKPPGLTPETRGQLEASIHRMNRHRVVGTGAPRAFAQPAPASGSGTFRPLSAPNASPQPSNAANFTVFRKSSPPGAGFTPSSGPQANPSDVDEPSVSNNRNYVVYTGNWYESESADSGATWTYRDPFTAFPAANGGFCCDQHTIYSPEQDLTIWQLLYNPDKTGANTLRLAVADGQPGLKSGTWHIFDITSGTFGVYGVPPGSWIDYPQLALTSTNLYVTFNLFRGSNADPGCYDQVNTVCNQEASIAERLPLADLAGTTLTQVAMFETSCQTYCVDTLTPVQRAGTTMYFGAHVASSTLPTALPDPSTIRIYEWPEGPPGTASQHDVADPSAFVYMNADGSCPTGNINMCQRDDSRVKTGWLGAGEVDFLWDAKEGISGPPPNQTIAPYPYLRGARINTTTWSLINDVSIGYNNTAVIYPDIAVNPRGGLALTMAAGGGGFFPSSVIGILDDISNGNWEYRTLETGGGNPPFSEWGDFLAVRPASGNANSWVATGYTMQGGVAQPQFAWFGRERDDPFVAQNVICGAPIAATMGAITTAQVMATFSGTSNRMADYSASVDWGDGTVTTGIVPGGTPAAATVSAGHAFASAGTLTATVTVTDGTGGTASCTLTATIDGSVYSTVSRDQYLLQNSDGVTWRDIDATHLKLTVEATTTSTAIISGNVDLWTANAGYNQDVGIFVNNGPGGADQLLAWKESGGNAGTFSPNAAYVQTVLPMAAGTYTIKLKWKTNKPDAGTIFAGAGPSPPFSPTRLTARIVPLTNPVTSRVGPSSVQYRLDHSDGSTWSAIDPGNLDFTFPAPSTGTAIIGANADLWTATAGVNQDIGIFVNDNAGSGDRLLAWKESGGFAGTFSPNAAFVLTTFPMTAGVSYSVRLKWKSNKPTSGVIFAGAGPAAPFSPTSLTMELVPSGTGVTDRVSTGQYNLTSSDGQTWTGIDQPTFATSITATSNCVGIVSGNADLWTVNAGYNQDLAILVGGDVNAWKESGGFAGTFSPNAAFVQTVMALPAGVPAAIDLQWKTNKSAPGASIRAAAGPSMPFSPTRLTVQVICS